MVRAFANLPARGDYAVSRAHPAAFEIRQVGHRTSLLACRCWPVWRGRVKSLPLGVYDDDGTGRVGEARGAAGADARTIERENTRWPAEAAGITWLAGSGCPRCRGTGFDANAWPDVLFVAGIHPEITIVTDPPALPATNGLLEDSG